MNKLLGYLKIKYMIDINQERNMALMNTSKDPNCMSKKHEVQKLEFFDSYEEFLYLVMNMNDNEKKLFISMPKESSLENYFLFDYVRPEDLLMHFEKKEGKTKCTFHKQSLKLKREYYKKRKKEND